MANVIVSCKPWHGRTVKSLELCLKERPVGLGTDSLGGYGLTFLLLFGLLLCLHGCIISGHVDDIDMLPGANGLQQAEESRSRIPSKERLQAVKHHSSVAVTQLKAESRDSYCGHKIDHTSSVCIPIDLWKKYQHTKNKFPLPCGRRSLQVHHEN